MTSAVRAASTAAQPRNGCHRKQRVADRAVVRLRLQDPVPEEAPERGDLVQNG